jgi:seryl-tRNA synthetase
LNDQINRLTQAATQWEAERLRLTAEVERLARVQAATQAEAEKALAAAKAARVSTGKSATSDAETITKEMERINGRVKEITALIDDPATELSTVIRKNVERSELESYLKGLRFALNGAGLK